VKERRKWLSEVQEEVDCIGLKLMFAVSMLQRGSDKLHDSSVGRFGVL
jgi:hypothetical protein